MAAEARKSTADWLQDPEYLGIKVLEPTGWDSDHFEASWAEPITQQEFLRRLSASTVDMTAVYLRKTASP